MHETFDVQLTKADYIVGLEALSAELAKLDRTRTRMTYQRLAVIVLLLFATGWAFPESISGLLFIVIGFAVFEGVMARFWIKSSIGVSYDPTVFPQRLDFSDAGIAESSAMRQRRWDWDAVRRVHDRPAALVFELAGWDMLVLPAHSWSSDEDRQHFVESVRQRMTRPIGEPISKTPSPAPSRSDLFHMAAIGAFLDVCLIVMILLPMYQLPYISLADQMGRTALVMATLVLSAVLGYGAYKAARTGLPRLDARSPGAASLVSYVLIFGFVVWLTATQLGWI